MCRQRSRGRRKLLFPCRKAKCHAGHCFSRAGKAKCRAGNCFSCAGKAKCRAGHCFSRAGKAKSRAGSCFSSVGKVKSQWIARSANHHTDHLYRRCPGPARHEGRRSGLTAEESLGQTLRQTVAPVGQTNSPGFLVQFRYSWSPKDAVLKGFWKESNAEGAVESIGSPYRAVSSVGRASAF